MPGSTFLLRVETAAGPPYHLLTVPGHEHASYWFCHKTDPAVKEHREQSKVHALIAGVEQGETIAKHLSAIAEQLEKIASRSPVIVSAPHVTTVYEKEDS